MNVLLSNDDGIDAPGLSALADALAGLGSVTVVAPQREQSASSHALTMHNPVRMAEVRPGWFAVSGTPADCVYMGVHHVLAEAPGIVVSGINRGTNIGDDVHYSGTVAAAMEAALMGIPSLAVSLSVEDWGTGPPPPPLRGTSPASGGGKAPLRGSAPASGGGKAHGGGTSPASGGGKAPLPGTSSGGGGMHWETAGVLARRVAELLLRDPLPKHSFLNLNVPNRPLEAVKGLRATAMGKRLYYPLVSEHRDPRNKPYYWIGGAHQAFDASDETDGYWFERGYATLTPLRPNLTDQASLARIASWPLEPIPGETPS